MRRRRQGHLVAILGNLGMLREMHEAELRKLVSQALGAEASTHELARVLGISRATVWRRFRLESAGAAERSLLFAGDEHVMGGGSVRGGSNVPAWGEDS